jgi:anti-sigma factor ChrR (cupin superfamily)
MSGLAGYFGISQPVGEQTLQAVTRLTEWTQHRLAKGPPVMAETLPEHMQQPATNRVALMTDQIEQPGPVTAGLIS